MAYYAIGDFSIPTRNVVLTERQDELIDTLVKTGRYQNASEVMREGLRLIEQREAEDCEQAWGPDADRHATRLISREAEGSSFGACSHGGERGSSAPPSACQPDEMSPVPAVGQAHSPGPFTPTSACRTKRRRFGQR